MENKLTIDSLESIGYVIKIVIPILKIFLITSVPKTDSVFFKLYIPSDKIVAMDRLEEKLFENDRIYPIIFFQNSNLTGQLRIAWSEQKLSSIPLCRHDLQSKKILLFPELIAI